MTTTSIPSGPRVGIVSSYRWDIARRLGSTMKTVVYGQPRHPRPDGDERQQRRRGWR